MAKKKLNVVKYFLDDAPPAETTSKPVKTAPAATTAPAYDKGAVQNEESKVDISQPATAPVETPATPPAQPPAEQAAPPAYRHKTTEEIREVVKQGYNPLYAMLEEQKPVIDEAKQERLRRIAGINSLGTALRTALQGYYGTKGATIARDDSNFIPQTYKEYLDNIKDYDNKKLAHENKLFSLKASEYADFSKRTAENEQNMLADKRIGDQQEFSKGQAENEKKFRLEMAEADKVFQEKMAKAKTEADKENTMLDHKNKLAQIYATQAGQKDLMQMQIEAGKFANSGGNGKLSSMPQDKPFVFRDNTGTERTLQPNQLNYIHHVIGQASKDIRKVTMDATLLKYADGSLTIDDANTLMNKYAHEYLDFVNGVPIPKEKHQQWNSAAKAVATSKADYLKKYDAMRKLLTNYEVPGYGQPLDPTKQAGLIVQMIEQVIGEKPATN